MRCSALVAALVVLTASACGGSPRAEPASPASSSARTVAPAPPAGEEPAPGPVTSLSRAKVKDTIQRGVGYFLQNVALEDWPAMKNGKFHGFRVKALNPQWNVDVKPGDVVVRVNGMAIEHPEDADAALRSLEKAPKLVVDLERDGAPRVLELPIVD